MFRLTYYASNEDVNSMKGEIDLKFCQRVQLSVDGGRKKHVFSLRVRVTFFLVRMPRCDCNPMMDYGFCSYFAVSNAGVLFPSNE